VDDVVRRHIACIAYNEQGHHQQPALFEQFDGGDRAPQPLDGQALAHGRLLRFKRR
jgi:hypothetical protein